MTKSQVVSTVGWGGVLWLIGYLLGIGLFFVVPASLIGWVITPIGIVLTVLLLSKKFSILSLREALLVGVIWSIIAIVGDYFAIVKLLRPADGYYKLDVYLYYLSMFSIPVIVTIWKKRTA